jgi:AbrB family looped-hinge helix DNA binding protein
METSILTSKGQLLIPKRLRTKYGINSGVKVIFEETKDGIMIKPMDAAFFESFAGILKSTGNFKEEMKQMKAEEKRLEERKVNLIFGKIKTKK